MLSYSETQNLLTPLGEKHKKLVEDTVPGQISVSGVQRVLQALLAEQVSIRDLPTILEAVSEATRVSSNLTHITEHVRQRLARQICHANVTTDGTIPILTLSPEWEQSFVESIVGEGEEKQLAMAPSRLQQFVKKVREVYEQQAMRGEVPVLLTSPSVRPYVRAIVERFRPSTVIMSQNEIHSKFRLKNLGQV